MNLLSQIQEENEDREWYPTTAPMLEVVKKDLTNRGEYFDLLDIGAGDGRALEYLNTDKCNSMFAIEQSQVLINSLNSDIVIIGTDFHANTLLDKKIGVIFCNPPYSEYEKWAERIILEANSKSAYLIIPQRWKNNASIKEAISIRGCDTRVLGEFDFLDGERAARAKIDIIRVSFKNNRESKTPFQLWFEKEFGEVAEENNRIGTFEKGEELHNKLIEVKDTIPAMLNFYNQDMEKLLNNYKAITSLDADTLKDFNINIENLLSGLEEKIKGLKYIYWYELFSKLDTITNRLTSWSRKKYLGTIFSNTAVDFNRDNIMAIVGWIIKSANISLNNQICEFYERMLDKVNIKAYKSNEKMLKDWRWSRYTGFNKDFPSKVTLTQRIILDYFVKENWGGGVDVIPKAMDFLKDIKLILKELGYKVGEWHTQDLYDKNYWWNNESDFSGYRGDLTTGSKYYLLVEKNGVKKPALEMKVYKKGTAHFKFEKSFIDKINVFYGREKGWLHNKEHAVKETGIKNADKYFHGKVKGIDFKDVKMLIAEK